MKGPNLVGIEEQHLVAMAIKIEGIIFDLGTLSDILFVRARDDRPEASTEEAYENFFQFTSRLLTHYKDTLATVQEELCNLNRI